MSRLEEQPFTYTVRKDGTVAVTHEGRQVILVGGKDAAKLLAKLEGADAQAVQLALAKVTGNFKRGNEKLAAGHQRNR
jgi:hypothetical protein